MRCRCLSTLHRSPSRLQLKHCGDPESLDLLMDLDQDDDEFDDEDHGEGDEEGELDG